MMVYEMRRSHFLAFEEGVCLLDWREEGFWTHVD